MGKHVDTHDNACVKQGRSMIQFLCETRAYSLGPAKHGFRYRPTRLSPRRQINFVTLKRNIACSKPPPNGSFDYIVLSCAETVGQI